MEKTLLYLLLLSLLNTLSVKGQAKDAVLTTESSQSHFFVGESVFLNCDMGDGEITDWKYKFIKIENWEQIPCRSIDGSCIFYILSTNDTGHYQCVGYWKETKIGKESNIVSLNVTNQPKAKLSASMREIPEGGSATLTCLVEEEAIGWKYFWVRDEKHPITSNASFPSSEKIMVTQGGLYQCFGQTRKWYRSKLSDPVKISNFVAKAAVILQHKWPQIYVGEMITLECVISSTDSLEWDYEWETTSSYMPPNQKEIIYRHRPPHNKGFRCRGNKKGASSTDWSEYLILNGLDRPKSILTVSPSWLSPGAPVTLSCEIEHPSEGWRFRWFQVDHLLSYEYPLAGHRLLPGGSSETDQNFFTVHGQTRTAGYQCSASRGAPPYYASDSDQKFVWAGDFHPSASLTVRPDRAQRFGLELLSLTCTGNSSNWRVVMFMNGKLHVVCSNITSTCPVRDVHKYPAVYWCESDSAFSNAVNISDHTGDVILVSPVHPVDEGQSVILGCKSKREKPFCSVFFYKNDKLVQNDSRKEMNISAVSKSDEGFYSCQCSGRKSPQSWMSVKITYRPEKPFFHSVLIGLVGGVLLVVILLLPLLRSCKVIKSPCCNRLTEPQYVNQVTASHLPVKQSNTPVYSTLLHGDNSVYEFIRGSGNNRHDEPARRYINITHLRPAGLDDTWTPNDTEECSYVNVNPK